MRIFRLSNGLNVLSTNSKGDIRVRNVRFFEINEKKNFNVNRFWKKLCNQETFLTKIMDRKLNEKIKFANSLKLNHTTNMLPSCYFYNIKSNQITLTFIQLFVTQKKKLCNFSHFIHIAIFISQNRKEIFNFKIKNVIKWTAQLLHSCSDALNRLLLNKTTTWKKNSSLTQL